MEELRNSQLEQLYQEMYGWLLGYANAILANPSRAEEAVQETFRIACDKPEALLASENPKGWLVNTLKGVMRNFSRRDARDSQVFVPLQDQHGKEQQEALPTDLLYQDLAQTREYELMKAVSEGHSVRELSDQLGISENTCKKRIQRSRVFLKKKMLAGKR